MTAQGGLRVEVVRENTIRIKPGAISTVLLKMENTTDDTLEIKTVPDFPQKWMLVTGKRSFTLLPHSNKKELYSFRVPKYEKNGLFSLDFNVNGGENQNLSDKANLMVEVEEVIDISVELLETADRIMAGETFNAKAIIYNKGNSDQEITLEGSNCEIVGDDVVTIAAGSQKTVEVTNGSSKDILRSVTYNIQVFAFLSGEKKAIARDFHNYMVLPVKEVEEDVYYRYPVEVNLNVVLKKSGKSFRQGLQGVLYSHGYLDENKTHKLTVKARSPNPFQLSVLSPHAEYFVAYQYKDLTVHLGDKSFSLSRLSDNRYGTGIQTEYNFKKYQIGAYYLQPRFYPEMKDAAAVYFNYIPKQGYKLGMGIMKKRFTTDPHDANILSLNAKVNLSRNTDVDAEFSAGVKENKMSYGYFVNVSSNWRKFNFSALAMHASKDFVGYYKNTTNYSGRVLYNLSKEISLSASIRQDFRNAALDTLFGAAPFNRGFNLGMNLRLDRNGSIRAYFQQREQEDRMPVKKFNYKESVLRVDYTKNFKSFRLLVSGEFGSTQNLLVSEGLFGKKNSYKVNADLGYSLSERFQFQGMVGYSANNRYTNEVQTTWTFGGSLIARLNQGVTVNLKYQNRHELEEYYRDRSLFSSEVKWKISKNQQLSVMANYAMVRNKVDDTNLHASVNYTYKIGVPVKKLNSLGSISGQVSNLSVKSVKGVVLTLNGRSVITDENGKFHLNNLKPGKYFIFLDPTSIGFDEIPDVDFPMEIEVRESEITEVYFGLTTAAKVKGKIEFKTKSSAKPLLDADDNDAPKRVILSLENGENSYRLISKEDGTFNFPGVVPGKWTLKVHMNGIPDKFILKKKVYDLNLEPGETIEVPIEFEKKERILIFKNKSFNLSAK